LVLIKLVFAKSPLSFEITLMMSGKKDRVVIGLSGGVDSSTAAALLLEQGYDVVGVTLKMWRNDCADKSESQCGESHSFVDAREISSKLGIPFYVIDESEKFKKVVIDYFASEYKSGKTPNPCVVCNEKIKFSALINCANELGAKYVATGHYAKVEFFQQHNRWLLKRGTDLKKDQSYFLFSLKQEQLARIIFPLGNIQKEITRELAAKYNLRTAKKAESQEICFVPDKDYAQFLKKLGLINEKKGEIINSSGKLLGYHDGIHLFTIGQRKGIKIAAPQPYYVIDIDPENNRVIVGSKTDLISNELKAVQCNWIMFETLQQEMDVMAKIRYNHPGSSATIIPQKDWNVLVRFHTPQRAITPGQACVFYKNDIVVGGGWIIKPK